MKRKGIIFLMCFTFVLAVTGCGNEKKTEEKKIIEENVSDNQKSISKLDDENFVLTKDNVVNLDDYQNIEEVLSQYEYAISSKIDEMRQNSTSIVEAEILSVEYMSVEGFPITKLVLKILTSLEGDLKENEQIELYKDGGYVPLKEFIEYFGDPTDVQNMTPEEIDATLLHYKFEDADPVVGEVAVYFLDKSERSFIPEGAYERVCGNYGVLKKTEEGKYRHHNMGSSETNREYDDLTLEEIKEEINNAN